MLCKVQIKCNVVSMNDITHESEWNHEWVRLKQDSSMNENPRSVSETSHESQHYYIHCR